MDLFFDHQKVKIIAMTQPDESAILEGLQNNGKKMSHEDLLSYCARISNPGNRFNFDTAFKLLRYLTRKKEWSPFEMVHVLMEIETTRDIARQILRHRSFSFQEFSQRYAVVDTNHFVMRDTRWQDTKNRQNSINIDSTSQEQLSVDANWQVLQQSVADLVTKVYQFALDNNIAKEQARVVLPEGMTSSRIHMSGTLRSWIHYVETRKELNVVQAEHVDIAQKAQKELASKFEFLQDYWQEDLKLNES